MASCDGPNNTVAIVLDRTQGKEVGQLTTYVQYISYILLTC